MFRPLSPQLTALLHASRIAEPTDRLPIGLMVAIAVATVSFALLLESRRYRRQRKLMVGFRAGVLLGLFASSLASAVLVFFSYKTLVRGAIKCLTRTCHAQEFTDLLGHQHFHGDGFISLTFQPSGFWFAYARFSVFTVLALFVLFGCVRSAARWRELD